MKKLIAAGLIAVLALPGAPLAAQQADSRPGDAQAASPAAPAKVYGPAEPTKAAPAKKCSPSDGKRPGEIVVCGTKDDAEFRVKSTAELDPDSKEATDDGQPHAPDFAESCKKNPGGTCIHFGVTPVPAYILDFATLPDTPEGSDADKIAKGEKKGD
jgi:hypothetical protein